MSLPRFNVIVAVGKNNGIGFQNCIPWNCPEDMKFFSRTTQNSVLIVGRNTAETLPPLKNRHVVIVGNGASFKQALELAVERFPDLPIFVIGGEKLYTEVLSNWKNNIDRLYLSKISENVATASLEYDRFFRYNPAEWIVENSVVHSTFTQYTLRYDSSGECNYLRILKRVLTDGKERETRNGITKSIFFDNMSFDLTGYTLPLLTTKKMFFRGIVEELLFFLRGDTDSKILEAKNVNIWKPNTSREFLDSHGFSHRKDGLMGPMYGFQWRHFGSQYLSDAPVVSDQECTGFDQLEKVIREIKEDPTSRRILMTSFNPVQADQGVLYPCHSIILQFYVDENKLSMFCYNRSQDLFLGTPFNIASSALLLMIVSRMCELEPGMLHISMGDIHLYKSHYDSASLQLENFRYPFPTVEVPKLTLETLGKANAEDFILNGYCSNGTIKVEMAA